MLADDDRKLNIVELEGSSFPMYVTTSALNNPTQQNPQPTIFKTIQGQ